MTTRKGRRARQGERGWLMGLDPFYAVGRAYWSRRGGAGGSRRSVAGDIASIGETAEGRPCRAGMPPYTEPSPKRYDAQRRWSPYDDTVGLAMPCADSPPRVEHVGVLAALVRGDVPAGPGGVGTAVVPGQHDGGRPFGGGAPRCRRPCRPRKAGVEGTDGAAGRAFDGVADLMQN